MKKIGIELFILLEVFSPSGYMHVTVINVNEGYPSVQTIQQT